MESALAPANTSDSVFAYMSDSEVELTRGERDGTNEAVDEPRSPPLNSSQRKWTSVLAQNDPSCVRRDHSASLLPLPPTPPSHSNSSQEFSSSLFDLPASPASPLSDRPNISKDIEAYRSSPRHLHFAIPDVDAEDDGKLDVRSVDNYEVDPPIDLLTERVAGALAEKQPHHLPNGHVTDQSTHVITAADSISMSLCGALVSADMTEEHISELFNRHRVTSEDFFERPALLYDPSLLVRVDNRLVAFRVAAPYVFSLLAFHNRMDLDTLARIDQPVEKDEPEKTSSTPSRRFRWFGWSSPDVVGEPLIPEDEAAVLDQTQQPVKDVSLSDNTSTREPPAIDAPDLQKVVEETDVSKAEPAVVNEEVNDTKEKNGEEKNGEETIEKPSAQTSDAQTIDQSNGNNIPTPTHHQICFSDIDPDLLSLRPTDQQLRDLDLKPGANSIRFIVESSEVELSCRIFLWSCHNKIVISDVDGTITRSDVLGHLLPAVGRDWSQVGVAGLYSQIERNGYKLLYLTARPIGQASQTRAFLHNVTQGSAKLPNGPVFMSPNRLVESFTREVIRRKPQEFKIRALREVRSLFPLHYNPFHAGFGNRDTDVISYRAVGLIPQRIFVVNPRGELVVTKARYESVASYSTLQDLVESVFPDITGHVGQQKIQTIAERATFNSWNYWKPSLPDIDLDGFLNG